jgi:hypothetical protein
MKARAESWHRLYWTESETAKQKKQVWSRWKTVEYQRTSISLKYAYVKQTFHQLFADFREPVFVTDESENQVPHAKHKLSLKIKC